jgi:photosystem II stability/assembly factor-like uncharacterized protein
MAIANPVRQAQIIVAAILGAFTLATSAVAGINAWTTTGPRGGWTLLAADPTTPGRVFAGREAALFRSTDDAATWTPIVVAPAPNTPSLLPEAMAWDPAAKDTIYASFGGSRLSKSVDGGLTWATQGAAVPFPPAGESVGFRRIAVTKGSARRLHALFDGGGLYTSTDDAATWLPSTSGIGFDFTVDPFRSDSIYFAGGGSGNFLRSDDGGATWQQVATGLDLRLFFSAIAADPSQNGRVYAAGNLFGSSEPAAIYVSNNRGVSWSKLGVLPEEPSASVSELLVDPQRPNVLVALAQDVLRSDDDGVTWRALDVRPSFIYGLGGGRNTALAAGPTLDTLYVGTTIGGVTRTVDAGATWEPRNAGLTGDRVTALAGATNPGFYDAAIARSRWFAASTLYFGKSGQNVWEDVDTFPLLAPPFSGLSAVVAVTTPDTAPAPAWFVLGDTDRVARSNNIDQWDELTPLPVGNYDKLVATSDTLAMLYVAGPTIYPGILRVSGGLAASLDGGQTWLDRRAALAQASGGMLNAGALDISALALDPQQPSTVWVGIGLMLFRSDDSGATWTLVANFSGGTGTPQQVDAIAVDPQDISHVVIAGHLAARVQESFDGGASWGSLESGFTYPGEVRTLAVDWAVSSRVIYVGTTGGVYVNNAAAQWSLVPGSDTLAVNAIVIARPPGVPDRMTLLAGTDTGVYEYTADPTGEFVPVYRFFNTATSTHFYTGSAAERDYVLAHYPTFQDEGIAFWALGNAALGALPVWRFFNTVTGTHFYTNSEQEYLSMLAASPQIVFEGIAFYVFTGADPGAMPGWQFYNSISGTHFYTASDDEVIYIEQHFPQFIPQGIHFGVYPAVPRQ